ncbi:DUF2842 domain-containing protein [Escherichia phage IMM-002]|uniref:DUF2842 domain-containing protein n=1 Tax=Escherichia phage IMM-002 TaxID=2041760 RepID=A0A384WIE5_9CAUD|nr:DUF2842 domain-containing protein [Escherichia phage IMM-002]ATI16973.1 DUF2842 domain-containing protein [Escherichia phage IMM-002]
MTDLKWLALWLAFLAVYILIQRRRG